MTDNFHFSRGSTSETQVLAELVSSEDFERKVDSRLLSTAWR